MTTAAEKFRERCKQLDDAELAKRLYLCSLASRIDAELHAFGTLCGEGSEPFNLTAPPDTRLTLLLHIMQQELKRRVHAKIQRYTGDTEEGETDANHAQNGHRN
jgi:hypothetical protein